MVVIGNRFTPAFAGSRPNGPTPAAPGPRMVFATATLTGARVNLLLAALDPVDTVDLDWGDGSARERITAPYNAAHGYVDAGNFLIRAIAVSVDGRESVNGLRVQVLEGGGPIPDPVADFVIAPAAPTTADTVTLTSISTPAEYIQINEWTQIMPAGGTQEGPPVMNLGLLQEGPYVWQLRVRLADGRWSAPRSRGVSVVAAEDPEDPPPDPEPEP
jgi:hypothetical protein